ncbi:unnamed protein product [Prorocentrum cordatum]|uniref:Solute carrier family 40 protein n=1 Tax=Prorocentrum cordatum TaxID=2364126 RepID=A0ABN9UI56_9DINO|nr:unnamed protein product [Polarella glacialis]
MTSLTGSTELRSLPDGPPFAAALLGAGVQLSRLTIWYVWWDRTTARECMQAPLGCLLEPWAADPWGRTVAFCGALSLVVWLASLRSLPHTGTSDPSIVDRLWSSSSSQYSFPATEMMLGKRQEGGNGANYGANRRTMQSYTCFPGGCP